MKKIFIFFIAAFIILLASTTVSAQSYKFGYINSSELLQVVPDLEVVQKQMQDYAKNLELDIEEMQVEYNKKLDAWDKNVKTWTDAVKATKQKELQDMGYRVQDKRTTAENDYNTESQKLMEPVLNKVRAAISKVGKDNGFTYIFDTSAGLVPFINTAQATDVADLVKKELNITK